VISKPAPTFSSVTAAVRFDLLRRQPASPSISESAIEKQAACARPDQLFRIGTLAVLEARLES
jgi:hypothetical protein